MPEMRPITDAEHDPVLALNQSNVELLAPMDEARLRYLQALAHRCDGIFVDGTFAGFVITVAAGTSYDSVNYGWFTERYGDRFLYLDRIVIDQRFRRRGLGQFVYDAVEKEAAAYDRLTLEVNLIPRNDASLAFHRSRGFTEVGQRGDEQYRVSLMSKELG